MTDRELLTLRTKAVDRLSTEASETRAADKATVARQFWRHDIAVRQADRCARITGNRFTVRRYGTTNSGKPVWEIAPVMRRP